MMKLIFTAFVMMVPGCCTMAENPSRMPLKVVDSVDFARYCGTWYEIARLPNSFENHCMSNVTATYSQLDDGELRVINECRKENGDVSRAEGRARIKSDKEPNSKLLVRFAPSFLSFLPLVWGDYWVICLAPDYSYAVVGEPGRKYLWILSRSPRMDETTYQDILSRVAGQGYDISRLIRTKQEG